MQAGLDCDHGLGWRTGPGGGRLQLVIVGGSHVILFSFFSGTAGYSAQEDVLSVSIRSLNTSLSLNILANWGLCGCAGTRRRCFAPADAADSTRSKAAAHPSSS
jgi:hypothetical protein